MNATELLRSAAGIVRNPGAYHPSPELADQLDALAALDPMRALGALGFAVDGGGAGNLFLSVYMADAGHAYATGREGNGLPTADSWRVGCYAPSEYGDDGDLLWAIHSDGADSGWRSVARLVEAATAAVATARLALAPVDPDEEPCPVNRCPKSRCPAGCDHGEGAPVARLRSWDVTLTATGIDVTATNEGQAERYAASDLNDASLGPWNVVASLVCPAGDPLAIGLDTGWEVEVDKPGEDGGEDSIWTLRGVRDVCVQAVDEAEAARVAADVIGAALVVGEG